MVGNIIILTPYTTFNLINAHVDLFLKTHIEYFMGCLHNKNFSVESIGVNASLIWTPQLKKCVS